MSLQDLRAPGINMAMKMAAMSDEQRGEYLKSLNEPMKEYHLRMAKGRSRLVGFGLVVMLWFIIFCMIGN